MPSSPLDVVSPIDSSAAAIEHAFLAAGQGLGSGLAMVEKLSRALGGFLGEFQSGRLAETSTLLERLARRLVWVSETLPRDAADLQTLAVDNAGIAKHLESLIEQIRMMTIIASSARIEAAVFGEASGLASFTSEMSVLTDRVRTSVGRCATDHAAMTGRVRRLVAAQTALTRDFREKLLALARELSEIFGLVTERQRRARALAEMVADGSARLMASAGEALMALQGGDAARQRLEHVAAALRLGAERSRSGDASGASGSRDARLEALSHLQAVQLDDLIASFEAEVAAIDGILARVSRDADGLATAGRALLGDDDGAGSFLARFRARLDEASTLIATCGQARRDVAEAMETLRGDVGGLRAAVLDLGTTTLDLIMVGINAGLRAARLGTDGRSLMVIADELKRLAGVITDAASRLVTTYEALDDASRKLGHADRTLEPEGDIADIRAIVAAFEDGDRRMVSFVAALQARTEGFGAGIGDTRQAFHATAEGVAALREARDALAAAGGQEGAVSEDAARFLTAQLWPHYTMARERDLHRSVLGCGPEEHAAGAVPPDDLLFGDAA